MKLKQAVEEVLKEDPRTREKFYDWLLLVKVLDKMGFHIILNFNSKMPHHESITRARRKIMNQENKFPKDFVPDPYTTYQTKEEYEKCRQHGNSNN